MKGEAGPGLKLGTSGKLDRSRAECKREHTLCAFPVPSLWQWREIIKDVLSPSRKTFVVVHMGIKQRAMPYRFCIHPFSGCRIPWGLHQLTVSNRLLAPKSWSKITLSCWAPNLDIQYLIRFIHVIHKKFQYLILFPHKPGPQQVLPICVNGWSHQDKKLKSASTSSSCPSPSMAHFQSVTESWILLR